MPQEISMWPPVVVHVYAETSGMHLYCVASCGEQAEWEGTMARSVYILAIVLSVVLLVTPVRQVRAAEGGGSNCAACTLVFQLVFNLADVHNESVERTLENFCTLLPGKLADEYVANGAVRSAFV